VTRPRRLRVWTEAELRERLRAGRPPEREDLVVGDGGHLVDGMLERGRWCSSVGAYLDAVLRDR